MIGWIKRHIKERREAAAAKVAKKAAYEANLAIITLCQSLIKKNWNTATTKYLYPDIKDFAFDKLFTVGSVRFTFWRHIRADLIRIFIGDKEIISYVDQEHQYPSLFRTHDWDINITLDELNAALGEKR